ncbi:hypothetical protein SAMN05216284_114113 [Micromonospora sediminimaris]|uniref:DUF3885 domain-containing protein n=1 Tax=Micromonospora sediminimaris TaxID=547162 RepID=A0A9W5UUN2_9ACTN|nr:hypothetical protein Vse01_41220 [Micromonospora sediminimaris]SFD29204.1 hypothetical protein SAMN05216284_114113 [Micromonospora sediminimaris]
MSQRWSTLREIEEALVRCEQDRGWERPVLHGIGFIPRVIEHGLDGKIASVAMEWEIGFVRVNAREDLLSAAVLATVTGWRGGSGSVRLGQAQLAEAIGMLAPAEACREVEHPNLRIWREIQGWEWDDDPLIVVFDADPDAPSDDPHVIALREVVLSGRQSVPSGEVRVWPPPGADGHRRQEVWETRWPQVAPIRHHLRRLDDRWVRLHSRPDSKRYADSESEYATILHRHNTILDELRGDTAELLVITLEVAFTPVPRRRTPIVHDLLPDGECWSVLSWPDLDPELAFAHTYVNHIAWKPDRLDRLLREVADDRITNVIIAPPDLAWLYAPYDGGADVLLANTAQRDALRDRHRQWLSSHPAGL